MKHVMKMQAENGCFKNQFSPSHRQKRKANLDKEGCVDHTNGLGASTLSIYLRYLLLD